MVRRYSGDRDVAGFCPFLKLTQPDQNICSRENGNRLVEFSVKTEWRIKQHRCCVPWYVDLLVKILNVMLLANEY